MKQSYFESHPRTPKNPSYEIMVELEDMARVK